MPACDCSPSSFPHLLGEQNGTYDWGALSAEQIQILAATCGINILDEDLVEVTIRINAFLGGVRRLDGLPLDTVQPIDALPHPEMLP